ncbi:universal stress protein [Lutibacter sp. B1]|uniref:universal stress protein n=1 Tax=Lutibacter sp. B1 TaxID=2725996 RepID=UPI00145696E2|nr:universal stress protein [Lutibacter sp. B1]NLP58676.1 universal stress protein [Lutibacter sp. B1]
MKTILIPTDFSKNSWNAIKYALNFFKNIDCDFYILHVTVISYYADAEVSLVPSDEVIEKTILDQAKTELQKLVKRIKNITQNPNHNFYTISDYNFFIESVKEQIEEKNIDLIVMGTKGASGIKEVIVGSNTGDLITKVKCPVLIIPENASFITPTEIAFPTDYNIFYPPKILNDITDICKMYNSTIRILHIARKDETLTDFQLQNKEFLNIYFMDEKHSFHRVTSKKVENGIQCFIESRNVNMIIMVAKNLNLFQRILFKPTVEEISYHTDIPFLVLHE